MHSMPIVYTRDLTRVGRVQVVVWNLYERTKENASEYIHIFDYYRLTFWIMDESMFYITYMRRIPTASRIDRR